MGGAGRKDRKKRRIFEEFEDIRTGASEILKWIFNTYVL
jgi:hypothetical protein